MKSERFSLLGTTRHTNKFSPRRMLSGLQAIPLTKRVLLISLVFCTVFTFTVTSCLWAVFEQYLIENLQMQVSTVAMEDPTLVAFLRTQFLVSPPPADTALNLTNPNIHDTYLGQSTRVQEILGNLRGGFFVEVRARDGETRTNTLALERIYNWTGLLVEPDPAVYQELLLKHRRAYLSPSCVSRKPYPTLGDLPVTSALDQLQDKVLSLPYTIKDSQRTQVQCFPLYTYLVALDRLTVDYLSLNIYGGELEVLENIPWDRVNIRVVSVKHMMRLSPGRTPLLKGLMLPSSKKVLDAFMAKKGYIAHNGWALMTSLRPTVTVFVKQ